MLETAAYLLGRHPGLPIFIDGRTFSRAYQVQSAIAAAGRISTSCRIIECVCAEETARQRLKASHETHLARNRTYELYKKLQAEFEPIPDPKLVVNTDKPLADCIARALPYLAL